MTHVQGPIIQQFNSLEEHTRKCVQMHSLARHLAQRFERSVRENFGETFQYTKLYYGKCDIDGELCDITVEKFIEGDFVKYINNDGTIIKHPSIPATLTKKAEAFAHYSYDISDNNLMVVDIQGCGYNLCDPEIATVDYFTDEKEENVLFCAGNCSLEAIQRFLQDHECNELCIR